MQINLQKISKRYRFEWIFRKIDFTFNSKGRYAILGPNGSGKSTLMKILSGHLTPSKGTIQFENQSTKIKVDDVYKQVAYAAPYIELIEEFSLLETIKFHRQFKPFLKELQPEDLIDLLQFSKSKNKEVRFFSSGMKQRLKLILAICSDTPLLLLDEPTTNLDEQGMAWYTSLINEFGQDRTIIVASNVKVDYDFCDESIEIMDYKTK